MRARTLSPPETTFKWSLYSFSESFQAMHDEFIVEGFRIRLLGCILELSFEASGTCSPNLAKALAQRYVEALGKRLLMTPILMTESEWLIRTGPPYGGNSKIKSDKEDQDRIKMALQEARDELLVTGDEVLRRCYGHLQKAHEHMHADTDQTAVSVYKMIEELESAFGDSEKNAEVALGCKFKKVKQQANKNRHREGKFDPIGNPFALLLGEATDVVRKYERYLLKN